LPFRAKWFTELKKINNKIYSNVTTSHASALLPGNSEIFYIYRINLDVLFITDFTNAKIKKDLKSFRLASSIG